MFRGDSEFSELVNRIEAREPGLLNRAMASTGIRAVFYMQKRHRNPSPATRRKFLFDFLEANTLYADTWDMVKTLRDSKWLFLEDA